MGDEAYRRGENHGELAVNSNSPLLVSLIFLRAFCR